LIQEFNDVGYAKIVNLITESSVYFGSSAGAILPSQHYYAWGSKHDNPFSRGLYHNGLGIFPDTLFEAHYSQVGFQSRLHQSVKFETWAQHFIGIDLESVVTIEDHDVAHAQVTLGTAEIIHRTQLDNQPMTIFV
jgi:cyanophycinase-like exopeptidase